MGELALKIRLNPGGPCLGNYFEDSFMRPTYPGNGSLALQIDARGNRLAVGSSAMLGFTPLRKQLTVGRCADDLQFQSC